MTIFFGAVVVAVGVAALVWALLGTLVDEYEARLVQRFDDRLDELEAEINELYDDFHGDIYPFGDDDGEALEPGEAA